MVYVIFFRCLIQAAMFRAVALSRGSLISRGLLTTRYSLSCLGNRDHFASRIHGNRTISFHQWSSNKIETGYFSVCRVSELWYSVSANAR